MALYTLNTVAPVFLVIFAGYIAVRRGVFDTRMIDALMKFAMQIAIPCLLFRATATIDLQSAYDWRLLLAYYGSALICFMLAAASGRLFFQRRPGEAVAVGFAGLFSNLVLLGLPIVERALGAEALPTAYAIISVHSPFCYLIGIVAMELLRADGRTLPATAKVVVVTMFSNNLMIGIGLGFLVNISGLTTPDFFNSAIDLLTRAGLPVALFGLGGVLTRYALSKELREAATIALISMVLHPLLVLIICQGFAIDGPTRSVVVLMAAMSPGVNAYLFASMYKRGEGTAASTVLISTAIAVFSVSVWLWILNPLS